MEVQIISQERIKPSFPTPKNLRSFHLSLLDQLIPVPFAPLTLFYPNQDFATNSQILYRSLLLKKSLSNLLTRFYPLAGKIKDELTIDCDDEGVYYVTARTNSTLAQILNKPELRLMDKFLPCGTNFNGSVVGNCVANIQLTMFTCGGISIGFCIAHKVFDGGSMSVFVKEWAKATIGLNEPVHPSFIGCNMFPANDLWLRDMSMETFVPIFKIGKSVTKRFLFKASEIATIREKASVKSTPTRIESLTAFLWKCVTDTTASRTGFSRPSIQTHVVNLRPRFDPPLSEHTIGNFIWFSSARKDTKHELGLGLQELACETRKCIGEINWEFIKKLLRSDERSDAIIESLNKMKGVGFGDGDGIDYYGFTSWCNFGFYEADFGWGRPIWANVVGSECPVFVNLIVLMDTRDGDGIEAWVTLDGEEMALLERKDELLKYSLLDTSPLHA